MSSHPFLLLVWLFGLVVLDESLHLAAYEPIFCGWPQIKTRPLNSNLRRQTLEPHWDSGFNQHPEFPTPSTEGKFLNTKNERFLINPQTAILQVEQATHAIDVSHAVTLETYDPRQSERKTDWSLENPSRNKFDSDSR